MSGPERTIRRTYGRIGIDDGHFVLADIPPHVAIKLKGVFPKIDRTQTKQFTFRVTPEACADLEWFLQRYPCQAEESTLKVIRSGRLKFDDDRNSIEDILLPDWSAPPRYGFKPGFSPRHEQMQAAEITRRQKRLLVVDSIGLGKTWTAMATMVGSQHLPAAVIVMAHLPKQWKEKFIDRVTYLKSHIIEGTKPYSLPPANVYIFRYTNIAGWVDLAATGLFKTVIFDEIQELRRGDDAEKGRAAKAFAHNAEVVQGLSVGPLSRVELHGGPFGSGFVGSIEVAWSIAHRVFRSRTNGQYEIVDLPAGISTRGWIEGRRSWGWKPLRRMIRHKCDRAAYNIRVAGRDLVVTEDHSVFLALKDGLSERRGADVCVGDVVLCDDGAGWEFASERPFDVERIASPLDRCQAVVDLSRTTRRQLRLSPQEWQNCHKKATYGTRLPIAVYQKHAASLPRATSYYLGRGKAPALPAQIWLSSLAYVFGFYIGDGWVSDETRICFAVENARVAEFCGRLEALNLGLRPIVRKMRGASSEVRCSHRLLAILFDDVFAGAKCYEKRIPSSWIVSWPEDARRELLRGLIDSDGCAISASRGRLQMAYTTTSKKLAEDVLTLLRSLAVIGGIHTRPPARGGVVRGRQIEPGRPSYQVYWSGHELNGDRSGRRGRVYKRKWTLGCTKEGEVRSNSQTRAPEFVYDFEVEGHPSFSADGVLVHNSATPIYGYGSEIFNIMEVVAPGALGSWEEFVREWCVSLNNKWAVEDPDALGTYLREMQLLVRREASRKPINRIIVNVDYDQEIADQAMDLAKTLALRVVDGSFEESGQAARELDMLARRVTGMAKARHVAAYVKMLLQTGNPVLLLGWHRSVYEIWLKELKAFSPRLYTGTESIRQKTESERAFLRGETDLLIMSVRSGAGLDGLQKRCSHVVHGELDWAKSVHDQASGRLDREGQTADEVTAHFCIANSGSDPVILGVHGIKSDQSRGILNPLEGMRPVFTDTTRMKMLAERYLEMSR